MKQFDWNKSQRQPMAGLAIVFLNTFWEVLKRLWPFLLLLLLGKKNDNGINRYEIVALIFLVVTIVSAVVRFIYFRFYIEDQKLVIKSGWLKKITKIIPLEKIQSVHIEQGPLHQALNIVKLSIDTAGSQKAEASIDALHKSMAEALKEKLESEKSESSEEKKPDLSPVLRLSAKDLLRLSISANHVEAFFILLSFAFGLYENLKDIDNSFFSGLRDFLPKQAVYPILFLIVSILFITILVSTVRIFLRFYDLTVFKTGRGLEIKSGLINVKEKLVPFQKIQFVSWKANWIRKLMQLWTVEYHTAGGDELKQKLKVQVPTTQDHQISVLVKNYYEPPQTDNDIFVRIDASFVWRRLLIYGVIPTAVFMPALWFAWQEYAFIFLLYPSILLIVFWCYRKKFRLWALEEIIQIRKGIFGEEKILMQWHRLQSIQITQSIFQRHRNLANIIVHTAAGNITVPFIPLSIARQLVNFALFKTESSNRHWM